jgi:hypothetical protein
MQHSVSFVVCARATAGWSLLVRRHARGPSGPRPRRGPSTRVNSRWSSARRADSPDAPVVRRPDGLGARSLQCRSRGRGRRWFPGPHRDASARSRDVCSVAVTHDPQSGDRRNDHARCCRLASVAPVDLSGSGPKRAGAPPPRDQPGHARAGHEVLFRTPTARRPVTRIPRPADYLVPANHSSAAMVSGAVMGPYLSRVRL